MQTENTLCTNQSKNIEVIALISGDFLVIALISGDFFFDWSKRRMFVAQIHPDYSGGWFLSYKHNELA